MAAIEFENVRKAYRRRFGRGSLRDALPSLLGKVVGRDGKDRGDLLWALDGVSFEVEKGEVLGIIGPNGAGKTTSLKLLSRVTRPTSGRITVRGRVSALIELGAGFHPDLSGRENIYLNGAILGLRRKEIDRKFDSIVAFSELEEFIDMPVKRYSSGMFVRLGFAVAVHAEPEVLLVDEVLAVGDMAFQRKCLERMSQLRDQQRTMVFISHNMRMVQGMCDRTMWLEKGRVRMIGETGRVVAAYVDAMNRRISDQAIRTHHYAERWGSGEARITSVRLLNGQGEECAQFEMGDTLIIEIAYRTTQPITSPSFDVAIFTHEGVRVCTTTTRMSSVELGELDGEGVVRCVFEDIPFVPGGYSVNVAIYDRNDLRPYDRWGSAGLFTVRSRAIGQACWHLSQQHHGVVYLPTRWEIQE